MELNKINVTSSTNSIGSSGDQPVENELHLAQRLSRENISGLSLSPEERETLLIQNDLQLAKLGDKPDGSEENIQTEFSTVIKRKGWRRYIGIMFAVTASVLFALATLIVKIMTKYYHPISVAVWRFQGIFWPSLFTLIYCSVILKQDVLDAFKPMKDPEKRKLAFLLMLRAVFGCSAVVLQFYSLTLIEMADSSVIAFSTPVFVTFVAYLFLGEPCGITPVLCALLTLCGVGVITRPPVLTGEKDFNSQTLAGAGFAFGSMLCSTMVFVLLRRLRAVHYTTITTFFGFCSSIVCLLLTTMIHPFEFPIGRDHWLLAVALALLTFVAHGSITLALKFEQAGPVSLIRTCDVVFAFVWQGIFLSVIPDMFSLLGAFIVVTGVVISAVRKWVGDLPENHKTKLRLKCLLA